MILFRSQIRNIPRLRYFSTKSIIKSSYQTDVKRKTLLDIQRLYETKTPISVVTAYDFITGKYAESADVDINLIGDSLAMVALGYEDTTEISFDEFLYHTKAVLRGNKLSFMVADIPFGSTEISVEQAVSSAIKLVKYGKVQGVKIEGGSDIVPTVKKLSSIGIPVMAHVGLTPQRHNALGGFKVQGNNTDRALEIYRDCLDLQEAGAFSLLLECIPNKLSEYITKNISIPTIGIGAGPGCSGQVLVMSDLLGMGDPKDSMKPKFVKQYNDFFSSAIHSLHAYKRDLQLGKFPLADDHGFKIKKEVFHDFKMQAEAMKKAN